MIKSTIDLIDKLMSQWNRIGTLFSGAPATETPDLERLVLDTVRIAAHNDRLFTMAATWLNQYGEMLARHRFKRMITNELDFEDRPVMGLLLGIAQQNNTYFQFKTFFDLLKPSSNREPRPLFDLTGCGPAMFRRAERRASAISKEWGLWTDPIEFKFDAIRPENWIMKHNPEFTQRTYFKGDMRASIMAALRYDKNAGDSESALAAASGGSRTQVHQALRNLARLNHVTRTPAPGKKTHIDLTAPVCAA